MIKDQVALTTQAEVSYSIYTVAVFIFLYLDLVNVLPTENFTTPAYTVLSKSFRQV